MVEQKYVRGAMMRALLYVQVSVSGQALVFVVRNQGYSLFQRAGSLTYAAFFLAQVRMRACVSFVKSFSHKKIPQSFVESSREFVCRRLCIRLQHRPLLVYANVYRQNTVMVSGMPSSCHVTNWCNLDQQVQKEHTDRV